MNAQRQLPIATRRIWRLTFGVGAATLLSYTFFPDFAYMFVLLSMFVLLPPQPPPAPAAIVKLLVILVIACMWGILLGLILTRIPLLGLLLFMLGMTFTIRLGLQKPELAIVSMLFVIGQTVIAAIAMRSGQLGLTMMLVMLCGFAFAFLIAWLSHLFWVREDSAESMLTPNQTSASWVPIRASIIMLPPFLAVLQDLFFIPLLIKGSLLAQQVDTRNVKVQVRDLMLGTAIGAVAAIILWEIISLWPNLWYIALCLSLMTYLIAWPLYGAWKEGHDFVFWQNVMVTMIILIGPAIQDPAFSDDIEGKLWIRVVLFFAISLYTLFAVQLLDMAHAFFTRKNWRTNRQWTS